MPALANEPFRAAARITIDNLGSKRHLAVGVGITDATPTGDQATWEGTPGSSLTLTFRTSTSGAAPPGVPNTLRVAVMLPGGNAIGTVWNSPTDGATRTLRFGTDPLHSTTPGANKAGTLELWIEAIRTDLGTYDITSRGVGATAADEWARGYVRAPVTLVSYEASDVSLGGAQPAKFYAASPVHNRWVVAEQWYRSAAAFVQHKQGATIVRSGTATNSTTTKDNSFTSGTSSVGGTGRVNKDYTKGDLTADVALLLPTNVFDELEYVWAAAGHPAGWVRTDDRTLTYANRLAYDNRVTFTHLLSISNNVFATPPSSADQVDGRRLASDLAFVASRATNMADSINFNTIVWTEKLWDTAQLVGSEASPVKTRSSTGTTQGGETSWADAFLTWDNSLPGGSWTQKQVITSPTDLVGLEHNNTRTLTLLASDPRVRLHIAAGDPSSPQEHWTPGKPLVVGIGIVKSGVLQAQDAGTARIAIARFDPTIGNVRYLDPTDPTLNTWTPLPTAGGSIGALAFFASASSPAIAPSPGNARLELLTIPGATTEQSNWTYDSLIITCSMELGGVAYNEYVVMLAAGTSNKHSGNSFDPTGLFK